MTSALELAAAIRAGKLSSAELTRAALARIAARNDELQAFVEVAARRALRAAANADRTRPRSPLHGIPIGVKDLNAVRWMHLRAGSTSLRWLISPFDDLIAARLRRAGMILVGKLATSELGCMPFTEPKMHPPTRNPIDPRYTSGGSSGGSGAAVGGGLVPIAHGSDGAGSIRIPAAFCGLVGFKPSRDRVPNPQRKSDLANLTSHGPLAMNVRDAAAFVDCLSDNTALLAACDVAAPRLCVRVVTRSPLCEVDPERAAAVERAATILSAQGHDVSDGAWFEGAPEELLPIWQRQMASVFLPTDRGLDPFVAWLRREGRKLRVPEILAAVEMLVARIARWSSAADLWLSPTAPQAPPLVGAFAGVPPEELFFRMAPIGAFTALFNMGGQPAVSLPFGRCRRGLPIGVQLAAPVGADALLFSVAEALQRQVAASGAASSDGVERGVMTLEM